VDNVANQGLTLCVTVILCLTGNYNFPVPFIGSCSHLEKERIIHLALVIPRLFAHSVPARTRRPWVEDSAREEMKAARAELSTARGEGAALQSVNANITGELKSAQGEAALEAGACTRPLLSSS